MTNIINHRFDTDYNQIRTFSTPVNTQRIRYRIFFRSFNTNYNIKLIFQYVEFN